MNADLIKEKYGSKLVKIIERVRPEDLTNVQPMFNNDEYEWEFQVTRGGQSFLVKLTLLEQGVRKGEGDGFALMLSYQEGSCIVGRFAPHGYYSTVLHERILLGEASMYDDPNSCISGLWCQSEEE